MNAAEPEIFALGDRVRIEGSGRIGRIRALYDDPAGTRHVYALIDTESDGIDARAVKDLRRIRQPL